uniref:Caspase-8 n=1 Tax=Leptobrachium leishanense TaxID=445787 RepID=A0A8C5WE97_9ANUR
MEFLDILYEIDSQLGETDVDAMKFLCKDILQAKKKLEQVDSGRELFDLLMNSDLLKEDDDFLLAELLYLIGQHSLLKKLNTNKETVKEHLPHYGKISHYRQILFEISENITTKDQDEIIFLLKLSKKIKRKASFLELLNYMEKVEMISEDNINTLEKVLTKVSPDLLRITTTYKTLQAQCNHNTNAMSTTGPAVPECETEDLQKPQFSIQVSHMEKPCDGSNTESLGVIVQEVHSEGEGKENYNANIESQVGDLSLNDDEPAPDTSSKIYGMNRKHRGYCLLISNSIFAKSSPRKGTEADVAELTYVFEWLGFEVVTFLDRTANDMKRHLSDVSKRDHSDRDCFVCCIMTHGESGTVMGTDNEILSISEIITYFVAKNCQTLSEKPKIFFIQACQGKPPQSANPIEKDAAATDKKYVPSIPDDADLLIGMSTVDGHCSFRHVREGTWYIQALCANLVDLVPRGEDVLSILTKVNHDVSQKADPANNGKQMPQPNFTLRKKIVFPYPGKPYNPNRQMVTMN